MKMKDKILILMIVYTGLVISILCGFKIYTFKCHKKIVQFTNENISLFNALSNFSEHHFLTERKDKIDKLDIAINNLREYKKRSSGNAGDMLFLVFMSQRYILSYEQGELLIAQALFDELVLKFGENKKEDLLRFIETMKAINDIRLTDYSTIYEVRLRKNFEMAYLLLGPSVFPSIR